MAEIAQTPSVRTKSARQPRRPLRRIAITDASLITAGITTGLTRITIGLAAPARALGEAGGEGAAQTSIARRAAGGAVWVVLAFGAGKVLGFLTNIILARLLTPGDFGLVSFAMILIGAFTLLQDSGDGLALIYTRADIKLIGGTALTINLLTALLLFAVTAVGSILMAWLSGAAITQPIVVALAFGPIVGGWVGASGGADEGPGLSPQVPARRGAVDHRRAGRGDAGAARLRVWSLVASYLAKSFTTTAMLWYLSPYRPRPRFDLPIARDLLRYGQHLALVGDRLRGDERRLLHRGTHPGSRSLGIYTLAFMIGTLPSALIAQQIAAATFPALSGLRQRPQELSRLFSDSFTLSGAVSAALGAAIFIGLPVLVGPLLGAKWLPIIGPLRILTIFGVIRALEFGFSPFYRAIGRPQLMWIASLLRLVVLTPALLWAVRSGIASVAWMQIAIWPAVHPAEYRHRGALGWHLARRRPLAARRAATARAGCAGRDCGGGLSGARAVAPAAKPLRRDGACRCRGRGATGGRDRLEPDAAGGRSGAAGAVRGAVAPVGWRYSSGSQCNSA